MNMEPGCLLPLTIRGRYMERPIPSTSLGLGSNIFSKIDLNQLMSSPVATKPEC